MPANHGELRQIAADFPGARTSPAMAATGGASGRHAPYPTDRSAHHSRPSHRQPRWLFFAPSGTPRLARGLAARPKMPSPLTMALPPVPLPEEDLPRCSRHCRSSVRCHAQAWRHVRTGPAGRPPLTAPSCRRAAPSKTPPGKSGRRSAATGESRERLASPWQRAYWMTPPPRQTRLSYTTTDWPGVTAHWGSANLRVAVPAAASKLSISQGASGVR